MCQSIQHIRFFWKCRDKWAHRQLFLQSSAWLSMCRGRNWSAVYVRCFPLFCFCVSEETQKHGHSAQASCNERGNVDERQRASLAYLNDGSRVTVGVIIPQRWIWGHVPCSPIGRSPTSSFVPAKYFSAFELDPPGRLATPWLAKPPSLEALARHQPRLVIGLLNLPCLLRFF